MTIYRHNLPESTLSTGVFLYCPECGVEASATRGDYFWMPDTEPFECECGGIMELVRSRGHMLLTLIRQHETFEDVSARVAP
jgi:hypothetical protein